MNRLLDFVVFLLLVGEVLGSETVDAVVPIWSERVKRHTGDMQWCSGFAVEVFATKSIIVERPREISGRHRDWGWSGATRAMSEELIAQLEHLRKDYAEVTGSPFKYFYCPTLRVDEDVPLCLGHVVNKPLPSSTRKVVVQRQDVDSFYGAAFEEDFQDAINAYGKSANEIVFDPVLRNRMQIDLFLDGEKVEWYPFRGQIAPHHSLLTLTHGDNTLEFVVKADVISKVTGQPKKGSFAITGDYRIIALVSLIKAAHLTQFRLLGYRYALSEAGEYVGRDILGKFFLQNHEKGNWADVRHSAVEFFRPYLSMMRPLGMTDGTFTGTVDDNQILACISNEGNMFGTGVFIRTSTVVQMVLVPSFTNVDAVKQYNDFLNNSDESFNVKVLVFDRTGNCWRTDKSPPVRIHWPKNHPSLEL